MSGVERVKLQMQRNEEQKKITQIRDETNIDAHMFTLCAAIQTT